MNNLDQIVCSTYNYKEKKILKNILTISIWMKIVKTLFQNIPKLLKVINTSNLYNKLKKMCFSIVNFV